MDRSKCSCNETYVVDLSGRDLIEEKDLLLRAADLIDQLGDPNYLKKTNALFYEFEEIGLNKTLGYDTSADIVYKFPQFYWNNMAAANSNGDTLSQCYLERAPMDSEPLW